MLERTERRSRYRECLELEAQYGPFMPCEGHVRLDERDPNPRQPGKSTVANPILTTMRDGFRALHDALRMP